VHVDRGGADTLMDTVAGAKGERRASLVGQLRG
jgi:hypothetical protein